MRALLRFLASALLVSVTTYSGAFAQAPGDPPGGFHLRDMLFMPRAGSRRVMVKVNTPQGKIDYPYFPDDAMLDRDGWDFVGVNLPFGVIGRSDSGRSVRGFIDFDDSLKTVLLRYKENGKWGQILPRDTRQIWYVVERDTVRGYAYGDCWLFQSLPGRITGYASYPSRQEPQFLRMNDRGPLYPYNQESVLKLVADNPAALRLAEKGRLAAAILKYNEW